MRHVVLTRAVYGPDWPELDNRARLELTRRITARLMAAQTTREWTWRIALDRRDALLEARMEVFADAAPRVEFLFWDPPAEPVTAPWDRKPEMGGYRDRLAASAYQAPWRAGWDDCLPLLMTRIDDDDGFAPDALARFARAAAMMTARTALMLPVGFRIWAGRMDRVTHPANAMSSLYTPAGDNLCIYDYGHIRVRAEVRTVVVDRRPGWLWIRHPNTLSGWRRAWRKVTPDVVRTFPIDWRFLGAHL